MSVKPNRSSSKTLWHRLLGTLLEELLTPVGVSVYTDFPLLSKSPEADILLLRRDAASWTTAQWSRLPDGIRQNSAGHILIEFKYTESINEEAILQTLGYDTFYKRAKHLKTTDVQTYLVSAKTPRAETLTEWSYVGTEYQGVYRSQERSLRSIMLLSLNDLADEPHNAYLKCFASRRQEQRKAFATLGCACLDNLTGQLEWFLTGLQKYWFSKTGEELMKRQVTPEHIMELGREWIESYLAKLPVEERLKGLKPQERLAGLQPQERLAGLQPQERLAGLQPQEVLSLFEPADRLKGLSLEEIENYLHQLRHNHTRVKPN